MTTINLNQDPFRILKIVFGILLAGFGFFVLLYHVLISFMFILPGLLLLSSTSGLEINTTDKSYRFYKTRLGFKKGGWNSLKSFTSQIILRKRVKRRVNGSNMAMDSEFSKYEYRLYLTTYTHITKIYLKTFRNFNLAKKYSQKIIDELNIPLEKYNPKISKRTKNRIKEHTNKQKGKQSKLPPFHNFN